MPRAIDTASIMRRVRSRDTEPELAFRKGIWRAGIRYRLNCSNLPGKPDIVIRSKRLAIFVDGDLWHGNQWRARGLASLEDQFEHSERRDYWIRKIRGNMERDCRATAALMGSGWGVLRFWESRVRRDLVGCVEMTLATVQEKHEPDSYSILPEKSVAEFFAGIGLVRMALERHGWTVAYANDIEPEKYAMYRSQFPDAGSHFDLKDVHKVPVDRVPSVALATASFPCNDLSLAGARRGLGGEHSSAFWGFVRILTELDQRRPPLVLLENVPGFLTSHNGGDFQEALLALNRLGYGVDAFLLSADRFVPQSRQRLFVVGVKDPREHDWGVREMPEDWENHLRPKALCEFIRAHPEIDWHLRGLPQPPVRTTQLEDILENLDEDAPEWWSPSRADYLLNQMSPRHRSLAETMINGPDWSYGTVFRRVRSNKSMAELRADGVAGCLRTPRGGSGRQILFRAGRQRFSARLLTPRECARLMGADDYHITVPLNQALFGFGDAVCVPVIEWIAQYYLNPLMNELIRDTPLIPRCQEARR